MIKDYIILRYNRRLTRVDLQDICYFEQNDKLITVCLPQGTHSYYGSLARLAGALPDQFCRCHRSYIVNMDNIISLHRGSVELRGGLSLSFSQAPYLRLRNRYIEYLGDNGAYYLPEKPALSGMVGEPARESRHRKK